MANKKGIGYSPLTEKVYMGTQNQEKGLWIGEKTDITSDFLGVSLEYFQNNTIRQIGVSGTSGSLIISITNDKKSIADLISTLNKRLLTTDK